MSDSRYQDSELEGKIAALLTALLVMAHSQRATEFEPSATDLDTQESRRTGMRQDLVVLLSLRSKKGTPTNPRSPHEIEACSPKPSQARAAREGS